MKIFVAKSINLILIIGIVYVYCTQAGKLKKNMADVGRAAQSHFADDGVYEGSGDGFGGKITSAVSVYSSKSFDSSGYTVTVSLYVPDFNGTRLGIGVGSALWEGADVDDKVGLLVFSGIFVSSGFNVGTALWLGVGVFVTPAFFAALSNAFI